MIKHHHPHHRQHHAPAPHEQPCSVSRKIRELIDMKPPPDALYKILRELAVQHGLELPVGGSALDIAASIDSAIADHHAANMAKLLAIVDNGSVLGAGEIPPHMIGEFLLNNIHFTQLHETDGGIPPHAAHFLRKFTRYKFTTSVNAIVGTKFSAIIVHAFEFNGELLVARMAAIAAKLWDQAQLVAIRSSHQAPHHRVSLGDRQPDLFIGEQL